MQQQWKAVASSPAVVDGRVFVGSYDGSVYSLDAESGALLWSFPTGSTVHSSPAVADGKVFVGSYDGKIYSLDENSGDLIWSYTTGNPVHSSPAVANGKVFVGSTDHRVYAWGEPVLTVNVEPGGGTVVQGESVAATVTIRATGLEEVILSVSGAPADVEVELAQSSGMRRFSSSMDISTSPSTPTGTYKLTVSGTAYGRTRTATYELRVIGFFERILDISLYIIVAAVAIAIILILIRRRRARERQVFFR